MGQTRALPVVGALVLTTGLVITLTACGTSADGETSDDGTITVVASTNVWGSVAERVGGDAVSVESLINDAAGDPHAHPDKPSDAAALAGADVVVYNGGGYDEFFTKLVDSSGVDVPRIDAFDLSGHEGDEVNEHVWYDLPTVTKVADALAEAFTTLAPDEEATFTENADALTADLDALLDKAAGIGEANPGAKVLATEPVAAYLLDAAGLTDATPPEFSEAIEEETDPPLTAVAETTDLLTGRHVAALVNNAQTETAVTNSLKEAADGAGIPIVEVTETLPEGVTDYVEWMSSVVDALAGALTKS